MKKLEETLHYACEKNEAFNYSLDLIDNGSTIKVKEDLYHHTPHHYAYSKGRFSIVEYFIEK